MRIGIDGRTLEGKKTGVGRYVFELCRALDGARPDARFFVYSRTPLEEYPVESDRWTYRVDGFPMAARLRPIPWLKLREGRMARHYNLDVFWAAGSLLPNVGRLPTVFSVYDLNHLITPQTMSALHLLAHRVFLERDLVRATRVVSISQGTSDRCLDHFGRGADAVVLPGLADHFKPYASAEIDAKLAEIGLDRPYVLSVATWEPRKNLETLIRAFTRLKSEGEVPDHRLALVGGTGWKDESLLRLVEEADRSWVIPLGYVPNTELGPIYAGADLFAFPSLYEGFGMPVLEARACGARVLTSDTPETREAGGADAVYVETSIDGVAEGIRLALAADRRPNLDASHRPTWQRGGETLADLLEDAAAD